VLTSLIAEFRGPGVHHNFDDSDSGYDVDMDHKPKPFGASSRGRIILLGDGTEVLTDSDDAEMFDHGDEDRDLDAQVPKGQPQPVSDALPEKLGSAEPNYKAVADVTTTKSTEKEPEISSAGTKDK
jgi:protein phosphatase 2C family protein 2/3